MRIREQLMIVSLVMGVAALAAAPAGAFVRDEGTHALEFPLEFDTVSPVYRDVRADLAPFARSANLGAAWYVQPNPKTGTLHAVYGGNIKAAASVGSAVEAEIAARSHLMNYSDVLGVRPDNMQLRNVRQRGDKYVVHFRQVLNGIPVLRSTAWTLLDDTGTVAAFGSDFFPDEGGVPAAPSLSSQEAVDAATSAIGATPDGDQPIEVSTLYVPVPAGELMALTVAYQVTFVTDEPFGRWESIVDGLTGEILARRNMYFPINVTGNTDGDVQNQLPALTYCDGSGIEALAHLTVSVQGGNSDDTDAAGDFDISHGGASAVTVDAELLGPYIDVDRYTGLGADASISTSVTPGTPATLSFTTGNARRDEMDTFFHGNRIRNFMFAIDNTFTDLDGPTISSVGRTDGFCPGNAWWNTGANPPQMNYCEENVGAGNANTGELANVVYHEYGHGITEKTYSRNGAGQPVGDLHEGNSDVVANFLDRNSEIGRGFFLNVCGVGTGIRNADNSLQWPADNNGGHSGGQIIAGFHWDAWQLLLATETQALADSIAFSTWHYARDLGTPTDQAAQVLWTFMMDDNDADLTNGTPHYDHFAVAAMNHGFIPPAAPNRPVTVAHAALPHTTDSVTGYEVVADITATGTLDPAELKVIYRLNGGSDNVLVMSATANPDEYSTTIPAQPVGTEIDYYVTASDLSANKQTAPLLAPFQIHSFDVATIYDDLESGVGSWTTNNIGATTGDWELVDPIGTAAQPGDDATVDPGVNAWITGQCSGPNCSGGCTLGCNDIDAGTVQLISPVYDLAGAVSASIKYDRWYSNSTGADPNNDTWLVEVSNNSGGSWTTVENTMASAATWTTIAVDLVALFGTPDQVQLRFSASDLSSGSIVEAGVDDIRVLADFGSVVDVVEAPQAAPLRLSLEQNRPNPFRPDTRIRFAVPQSADVKLNVYDVQGRTVRQLVNGQREAGRYTVEWNGRDEQGARVAAGVYFYRLTAGAETLTRKMTVLK